MVIGAIIWNCWFLPTRNSWILAVSQFTVTQFTVLHSKSLKVRRGFRHWCLPFLRILILRVRSAMLNLFNSNSVLEIMILIRVMGIFIVLIWSPNKSYLGNTSFKYISVKDLLFPVTIDSILCFKQFFLLFSRISTIPDKLVDFLEIELACCDIFPSAQLLGSIYSW